MNRLSFRKLAVFIFIFSFVISVCEAQPGGSRGGKPQKKGIFGLFSGKKRGNRISKPKSVKQIQKEQAKKKKEDDAAYAKSVKESQKRTIKIQTPVVQERMKQNQKEVINREKAKKKKTTSSTKKAAKKYKK
jgi:hypothetical protein